MDIEIPPGLQWVSYLAGGEWPQGSETGMFRIEEHFGVAAADLEDLIPDLNRVREETLSVLMGETADAADEQFAMLFDGDYAVDKLAEAMRALGESAGYTGSEIEYSKLSILVGLALAAAEITYALAMAGPTWGASTAAIPAIEWATITTIRQLIAALLRRLAAKVRDMLLRTTVKRLLHEGFQEAGQELAIAATQEGIVYGLQGDRYRVNGERLLLNGIASTVGGGAGGVTAVPTSNFLGPARTRMGAAGKGATTFFTAGVAGNLAGTAAVGGEFDPLMIVASSTSSSIGGLGGAGVAPAPPRTGNTNNGQLPGPQSPGTPPDGEGPPPVGPQDDGLGQTGSDPSSVNSSNNNGEDPSNVQGAHISEPQTDESAPASPGQVNGAATHDDPSSIAAQPTADDEVTANDGGPQSEPQATPPSENDVSSRTPEGARLADTGTDGDLSGHDPIPGAPIADIAGGPSTDGQPVDGRAPVDPSQPMGPEPVVAQPTDDHSATTPAIADTPKVAETDSPAAASPTPHAAQPPIAGSAPPSPSTTSTPGPTDPTQSGRATTPTQPARDHQKQSPDRPPTEDDTPAKPAAAAAASTSQPGAPVARVFDIEAARARRNAQANETGHPPQQVAAVNGRQDAAEPVDCLDKLAAWLSEKLGRPITLAGVPSPRGRPAIALFHALGSGSVFADYAEVRRVLRNMEDGAFAILTSAWTGGPDRGGHAYLAFKDGDTVRFEDISTELPVHWDEGAVLRTAVGYFHADGQAVQPLRGVRQLVPAAAIGEVAGPPLDEGGAPAGDPSPGDQWQGVVPQSMLAESALERRGLTLARAADLRNPLGLMEAACERAQNNFAWWESLTGAEQRALIDTIPQHIGNAEGIPASARHEANKLSLDRDRARLKEWSVRGKLTRLQRKELARLDRIDTALSRATDEAEKAELGGPLLIAFDAMAFGGDGRAVVAFGTDPQNPDPYKAASVAWHVPGQGITIDQIGACMGDALNHLKSVRRENSDLNAASIAWIGYDTPSGLKSWRAAFGKSARAGGAILYSDIRAFNTAHDLTTKDGEHFTGNHIFAHSYGSTATSHAGRDGRLAGDVRTITLAGSPGAGPLRHASEFGIGARNVFVASSSRDRFTALGGRTQGSNGWILGLGLGIDPAMDFFGAQRLTSEFPAAMDRRSNRGTHNAYLRFVDKAADVRSESLANFGRIAAERTDQLHFESHRTVDDRPYRLRRPTIDPATGRPLRLDGDTGAQHSMDRLTRRPWKPRWGFSFGPAPPAYVTAAEEQAVADLLARRGVDSADALMNPMVGRATMPTDETRANAKWWAELTPAQREALIQSDPQRVAKAVGINPADLADARARANAAWWQGLTPEQRQLLIKVNPHQIGNTEGIYAVDRDTANRRMLERYKARAGELQAMQDRGGRISDNERKFVERINRIDKGLQDAAAAAKDAGVGRPLLIAFDPLAFGGDGRAAISFTSDRANPDPYRASSVSVHVPGVNTTIDDVGNYHDPVYFYMRGALAQLQSTMREDPDISAASILWIGYDAPSDSRPWQAAGSKRARAGGDILYSDIRAFNAARNTWTADGGPFKGIHVFGHSYGSTTTSYAGRGGRLADHVTSVTLLGSPGAGPMRHASDFGIGNRVFVAASSYDRITALGGRTPSLKGRYLPFLGLGTDPAMISFGALRITSEFSDAMNTGETVGTHRSYYEYADAAARIRSESLANFGRIAAGRPRHEIHFEAHRTVDKPPWFPLWSRTAEPAAGRPLRLDGDVGTQHSDGRHIRHFKFNPFWRIGHQCGPDVVDFMSGWHDRTFELAVAAAAEGVPARAVFEALRSGARFASYSDVYAQLKSMEPGSSAVLTSSWAGDGGRRGGHAYVAIFDGVDVFLWDPLTRTLSEWPPYWGTDAVSQTAVGYFHRNGDALNPLHDPDTQLVDADAIGDVAGVPASGHAGGPTRSAVQDALALRRPQVPVREVVNPLGDVERAVARARENVAWWDRLSPSDSELAVTLIDALLTTHPHQIGNAEGIPAKVRDDANREVLRRASHLADRIEAKAKQTDAERKAVERVRRIEALVDSADLAAQRAGLEHRPLLLAFDQGAFGRDGRLLISFGDNPDSTQHVAWHIARRAIDRPIPMRPVLDQLQSAQRDSESATAILWIGNNTVPWGASRNAFFSDVAAFHAARDARVESGAARPLTGSSVHALRHPSTTIGHPTDGPGRTAANPLAVPADAGPFVIAHRGASYDFPEQTMAAYKEALRQGANGLECDVHLTKDGHLVCIHDKKVDRTSDGTGRVDGMTLAELQALDFGSWHPGGAHPDAHGDTGILTLERLLQLVRDHDRPVTLFIEIKHSERYSWKVERELAALLKRYGMDNPVPGQQPPVAVISFFPDGLKLVRSLAPNLPTVFLAPRLDLAPLAAVLASHRMAEAIGANGISHYAQTLRAYPELVDLAAAHGMIVYPGVVNEQIDAQYANVLGAPWVGTDHPGRAHSWLGHEPVVTEETPPAVEPSASDTGDSLTEAPTPETPTTTREPIDPEAVLAKRVPPVRPDELRNPLGRLETNREAIAVEARARARNNATWWQSLTDAEQDAVIKAYPEHIGNAEGIPPKDRHTANEIVLNQLRAQADQVRTKISRLQLPSIKELRLLRRVNKLDQALDHATRNAARVNEKPPLLLAFDPAEFGGDGRAVISFGDDPVYEASAVSWHAPGIFTTMHSRFLFPFYLDCALNHLQATRAAGDSNLKAASIAWIGYDTPSGLRKLFRMAGHKFARAGGDILHSDIAAFNAGRDVLAPASDGKPFTGNHVFGYSYGSTATGYAGQSGRLADHVTTITLLGSPGAGPVKDASGFGIPVDRVFVASSSRDLVPSLGGRRPGSSGRILGIGLGHDPAMDTFGAVRVAAEFPTAMNRPHVAGTHDVYYRYTDAANTQPTESLANFGRIAAGDFDNITHEKHRTAEGLRTVEPAADRSARRLWNPSWRRQNCAQSVVDQLSQRYKAYKQTFRLAAAPTRRGVPARTVFEAANIDSEFATYEEVEARLLELGDGSSAILTSRWQGWRGGGHAYLAVNDGGRIYLLDMHSGKKRSGWPPHWGQGAVTRTAVGYLDAQGKPAGRTDADVDVPLRLDAADEIGHVKGLRGDDSEFSRRQQEYRDPERAPTRPVDTRYAERLGDVVDRAGDLAAAKRLAADLSGKYGPYRIRLDAMRFGTEVMLSGVIINGDTEIGTIQRIFDRDSNGNLVAYHTGVEIKKEFQHLRGKGFSKALTAELERFYLRSGVDRIELRTHDKGGFAWANRGFTWDLTPQKLQESLDAIKRSAARLRGSVSEQGQMLLDQMVARLDADHAHLPEPIDLADLSTPDEPDLGRQLLDGVGLQKATGLNLVKYLRAEPTAPQRSGLKGALQRVFGFGKDAQALRNCAHMLVKELSAMYPERKFDLAAPRSPMGVTARALFTVLGSSSEFATYADVERRLRDMASGSSAVLASRWAHGTGRYGGHAYLAVKDGDEIFLFDPHTGQRSAWPPSWGPEAVTRTAVGFLDADGNPIDPLHDVPLQLAAADKISHVRGRPDDPDFVRRQEAYRASDPVDRRVDTRYAAALSGMVDAPSSAAADQLAKDLSGRYGQYTIELEAYPYPRQGIVLDGEIFSDGREVGVVAWRYERDDAGRIVAHHELHFHDENFRGREFYKSLMAELAPFYQLSGVDRIVTTTHGQTAYAAADVGETWAPAPKLLQESLDKVRASAHELWPTLSDDGKRLVEQTINRLDPWHPRFPEPIDLAHLATPREPDLGRRLLAGTAVLHDGTGVHYVRYLWNPRLHSDQNCGPWSIDQLSHRYGIPYQLNAVPSPLGVPARALFEAIGSRADFMTYAEVEELLSQMDPGPPGGPGPAALLVSSWADGRSQGGHAYLAFYDGGRVYLKDAFTGERLGWPPYWGEGAVSRTAVGFLTANGRAVQPLDDSPNALVAADTVGHVQGHPDDPNLSQDLPPVSGSIVLHTPSTVVGITGPVRRSVTGLVTGLAPESRTAQTASIVLHAVEVRGPTHNQLSEALGDPGLLRIDHNDLTVRCRVQYRIFDSGNVQATIIYAEPALNHPSFDTVRRMIDAALQDRFPNKSIEIAEMYDYGDRTDMEDRELPARDVLTPDPVRQLGLPDHAPGTLSDAEAREAYAEGERRMRELNDRLARDGVGVQERARRMSELRDALRAWMRDRMSNRVVADFLATYEANPTFDELVAHNVEKGLHGDAVYEAIIGSATHGHIPPGSLSDIETTARYTEFELRMRDYNERLIGQGVSIGHRARILSELRDSLRAWTRDLMSNRVVAEFLAEYEGSPTFEQLVAHNAAKGLAGDAVYEAIIHSATHSHYAQATLSDDETRIVYTTFELRMREVREQLVRDGVGLEERARTMHGMRAALRSWTRALMENRELAEFLNSKEANPAFEALVERQRKKGLTGDAIYEAIIASSTRSRASVNDEFDIDPDNPPPLPPMRGATDND